MYALSSSEEELEEYQVLNRRRKKVFRERINYATFEAHDFKVRFRLRPHEAEFVLHYIGRDIQHRTPKNKALSPQQQLLTALHWLSNGAQFHGIADMHGISSATVCRSVRRVVYAILNRMLNRFVRWPNDCTTLSQQFMELGGFPMVCGAVDGSLIPILAPRAYEEQFVDRHGGHSLNCMMVGGADYMFYAVNARFPGSVHDARVLRSSTVAQQFNGGYRPFTGAVILGDSAYGLSDWLVPPLRRNPDCPVEQRFNRAHKRTRRIIECSFGMLKHRFPCLRFLRLQCPKYAARVVMACVVLHNIATKSDFPDVDEHQEEMQGFDGLEAAQNGEAKLAELLNFFR